MRELDKEVMFSKDNIITPIPPFEFCHSQENNKALTEAQVCYAYVAEEERNKKNRKSEGSDSLEVTQKGVHIEFDFR